MSRQTIFVIGATGVQGGAVARALLSSGVYSVNALVRDPTTAAAQALATRGASLIKGDWEDIPAIEKAASGSAGLFLNSYPSFTDSTAELRQAQNILKIAKAAGVKHVIHSSATAVHRHEELVKTEPGSFMEAYYLSKSGIENAVRNGGLETWTIFRGANFATNFLVPSASTAYPELALEGLLVSAVTEESKLAILDPEDLGKFALAAFSDPLKFGGNGISIAAELLSLKDIAKAMEKVSGKKVDVRFRTEEEIAAFQGQNPFVTSQFLLRNMHLWTDLKETQEWGIPLGTFEEFLIREKERLLRTIGH